MIPPPAHEALDAELEAFIDAIDQEHQELVAFMAANPDSPFVRRTKCRSVFACIQAIMSYLANYLILWEADRPKLSPEAVLMLRDAKFTVDGDGTLKTEPARISFRNSFLFLLRCVSEALDQPLIDIQQDRGWSRFCETIRVRDRITHPKSLRDLNVTEQESLNCEAVYDWAIHMIASQMGQPAAT